MLHDDCTTVDNEKEVAWAMFQYNLNICFSSVTSLIWLVTLFRSIVYTKLRFIAFLAAMMMVS